MYVYDCLCISENPKPALIQVDKYFLIKPVSLGPPKTYLVGTVSKIKLPNGVHAWAFSSSQYVHEAVKCVVEHLEKVGGKVNVQETRHTYPNFLHPKARYHPRTDLNGCCVLPITCGYSDLDCGTR